MSRSGSKSSDSHPTKIAGLYDLEETLGRGHFAVVKLARHVFTGEKVAVKVIDKTKLDPVSQDHLFQEVRCMKLVQHPNVVRLYEVIDTNSKLYLILELGDGGDLYDYIMKHDAGLSEEDAREYFAQIVRAISFCHKLHVVHRDLKPENVVFFERLGVVKLTDFGFSNRFNPGQKLETSCGSLAYSAPEILLGDSYDAPAVDVWSLGVILYMLVAGQAPFQEANDSETLTMIMDVRYRVPDHVTDDCKRLIGRMLVRDPGQRATLAEIAADPWLSPALQDDPDVPLVSRETVSEEDHNFIVTKMVNGKIANKEDILDALDKDEYNHITATYYLLAERKLRLLRAPKNKPLPSSSQSSSSKQVPFNHPISGTSSTKVLPPLVNIEKCSDHDSGGGGVSPSRVNQALLSMSRHPGDVASRSRKCSIVTEEEDDDEDRELEAHDRRGSRSEGKLNLAVAELRRESILLTEASTAPTPLQLSKCHSPLPSTSHVIHPIQIKTLPSSLEAGMSRVSLSAATGSGLVNMKKLSYRSGGRTASVSSSEASDEDEARHSRRGSTKSLGQPPQPPPPGGGGAGGSNHHNPSDHPPDKDNNSSQNPDSSNNNNSSGGTNNSTNNISSGGTTHSNSLADGVPSNSVLSNGTSYHSNRHKRRGGETRLRESQSLNRITEVVETEASAHSGCETEIVEVEPAVAKENVCFRCCMEEMCSIEKRLVCAASCAGRTEQNNNRVKENSKLVEGNVELGNVENVEESIANIASSEPRIFQAISPTPSTVHTSQSKNLTNVYSRQNKYRYIHNSNTGGGKMSSSISCSDIPDGNAAGGNSAGGDAAGGNVASSNAARETAAKNDTTGAIEKSSRKFNTITRIRNRHNKENASSEGKSKQDVLPSNGSAGTNQSAKTSVTSNGQTLPVVNKNKKSNKNTLINRYLYLQKKLVMPLFGGRKSAIKSEGRLYKAKSCSEVEKTSCTGNAKMNVLSKNRAVTMTRCSKHVTECTTGPLKLTASIVNIDHRTSTAI